MKFYKSWQQPTAISFDLDDTLYDNVPVMERAEVRSKIWMADQCDAFADWSVERWAKYRFESALLAPEMGQDMTALRVFSFMRAFYEQGFSKERSRQLAADGFHYFWHYRNDFQVADTTRALLEKLAARYPLVVITNGNADPDQIGLGQLFTHVLHPKLNESRLKPHPDLFRQAEQLLGLHAKQWLHVGDHLTTDVQGALMAGWQAAWFNNKQQTMEQASTTVSLPHFEYDQLEKLVAALT